MLDRVWVGDYFGTTSGFLVEVNNLTIENLVSILATSLHHEVIYKVYARSSITLAISNVLIRSSGSIRQYCKFKLSKCEHCKEGILERKPFQKALRSKYSLLLIHFLCLTSKEWEGEVKAKRFITFAYIGMKVWLCVFDFSQVWMSS